MTVRPLLVDDELGLGVAAQNPADEADVVEEAGDDEVHVIFRLDPMRQRASAQNVAAHDGHQHGVLVGVIERVAAGDALDRRSRQRAEPLGFIALSRAKNLAEVFRQKLAKFLGRHRGNCFHLVGSPKPPANHEHRDVRGQSVQ